MSNDFKAAVRARMRVTGEKYTEARRHLLATRSADEVEEVTVHTTRNGLPLAEDDCTAATKTGRRCRNPYVDGQFWPGGHREVSLEDGPETRKLAQRRCHVHVDHSIHARVTLVMDDVGPGPSRSFAWQDRRSLDAIRGATAGRTRADALTVYLALTEGGDLEEEELAERAGVSPSEAAKALRLFDELGLLEGETLVA